MTSIWVKDLEAVHADARPEGDGWLGPLVIKSDLEAIKDRVAALEKAIDHRNGRHALPKFQPIGGAGNGA